MCPAGYRPGLLNPGRLTRDGEVRSDWSEQLDDLFKKSVTSNFISSFMANWVSKAYQKIPNLIIKTCTCRLMPII